jgi:hypothetical protein
MNGISQDQLCTDITRQKVKCKCTACLHVSDFRTAKIPSPPPGHKWKEVRHDNKVRNREVRHDNKVRNQEVRHDDKVRDQEKNFHFYRGVEIEK